MPYIGQFEESFVAAESGGESEKGQVVAGAVFVAVVESAVAGQPEDMVRSMTHLRRPSRSLDSMPLRAILPRSVGFEFVSNPLLPLAR